MKTIVISGAHSNVGKTTLAARVSGILEGAVNIKIGHGKRKKSMENVFYHKGVKFAEIEKEFPCADFLVIESNSVLEEISPECVIYLPGGEPKDSARAALAKADIIRGVKVSSGKVADLSARLGLGEDKILEIIEMSGAKPPGANKE